MRVTEQTIIAPDLPAEVTWLNHRGTSIDVLLKEGPVLIEFWDFARVNSLHTLPYIEEWHRRYSPLGATFVGIHSPGYSFGSEEDLVRRAVERLAIEHPLILDPAFIAWREYGNKGWPARYLWSKGGELRYFHYGEGDYLDCELAIHDALVEYGIGRDQLPAVMPPLRAEDAPGAEFAAQTADIALPPERDRLELTGEWKASADWLQAVSEGSSATARSDAGRAYAILSGKGIDQPGPLELPIEGGRATFVAVKPGVRLHGFQFTPELAR